MNVFGQLKEKVTQYVDVYVRLLKINFIGRAANLLSSFIFTLIAFFIVFCILLFLGLGLVEVFINLGASKVASFFFTIGTYFILLLIVASLRRPITRFFASAVIKVLTDGDEEERPEDDNH